jgi:hypothetical protein
MFRAEIKKDGVLTNYSEFKTLPETEAWISENAEYFPQGYTAEIIDVSAIKRKEKKVSQAMAKIDFGAQIMAEIVAINEERLELGALTEEQFTAMLQDPLLYKIERCLWNGSLQTSKALMINVSDTFFTAFHKEYIIDKIDTFLISLGEAI